jgi:hypothetical protein
VAESNKYKIAGRATTPINPLTSRAGRGKESSVQLFGGSAAIGPVDRGARRGAEKPIEPTLPEQRVNRGVIQHRRSPGQLGRGGAHTSADRACPNGVRIRRLPFGENRLERDRIGIEGGRPTDQDVVAATAVERITAQPSDHNAAAGSPLDRVVAGIPDENPAWIRLPKLFGVK